MREGPKLGVAEAARAPPCTLPILGRRFYMELFFNNPYLDDLFILVLCIEFFRTRRRFKKLEKEIEELKKGSSKQERENDSDFWKRYEETKPK